MIAGKKAEALAVRGMAGSMVLLGTLDAYLTTKIVVHGGGYELNPVMRHVLNNSVTGFWLIKIVGSVIAAYLLVRIYRKYPKLACFAFGACLAVMAGIVAWNFMQK